MPYQRVEKYTEYDLSEVVTANGSIIVECNTVTLRNQGTKDVTIDGTLILKPDISITFGGRLDSEVNDTFTIAFDSAESSPNLLVIKEFYVPKVIR